MTEGFLPSASKVVATTSSGDRAGIGNLLSRSAVSRNSVLVSPGAVQALAKEQGEGLGGAIGGHEGDRHSARDAGQEDDGAAVSLLHGADEFVGQRNR